ncbi:MAG: GNAT family N-acetyltransferase [Longimicrobiales bacterium]
MAETLHCRFARPDEIPEVGRMVAHSFPGPTRTPGWWDEQLRDPRYGGGAETLLIGAAAGRIVAACQLHPLRQWVAGTALKVAGVGTVAISPAHRQQRFAGDLLTAALRAARARGDVASALYPFRVSFYRRLGYGDAGAVLQWRVPPASLPDAPERLSVEVLESAHERVEALALYDQWARSQTGQLERSGRVWTHLCTLPGRALFGYRASGGELEGYAFVTYRVDLPRAARYLEVEELVWTTDAARRGLYGWLASLGDQWERLLIRTLPGHRLADWLSEPRLPHDAAPGWGLWTPAATLLMGPMFRLLDVGAAWEQRRAPDHTSLAVACDVDDPQIEENRGCWRLTFDAGRVRVERDTAADLTLRLDISTLSRLYIGALSATAGVAAGLIACDRPDLLAPLDGALTLPVPWTFDRF